MSVIINKPAPGGSSGNPPTITFDTALINYGDTTDLYDKEIRTDLLREIVMTTQSATYSRSSGIGIDMYENESVSENTKIILRLEIMAAVDRYNSKVLADKQIITSQDLIDFDSDDQGTLYINIFYMQNKDMLAAQQGSQIIKNIILPVGS